MTSRILADPSSLSCFPLFSDAQVSGFQSLDPDLSVSRARDARGRFAKGSSGNPRGRPRGIPNPRRRVPDLVARPLSAQALSDLIDRKPHLLRPLAVQFLPPPIAPADPVERLGIDLLSLRTVEDLRQALSTILAAVSHGEIGPREGARTARRARARWRSVRRLARLERRVARETQSAALTAGANSN